jgi:hypothetical protein
MSRAFLVAAVAIVPILWTPFFAEAQTPPPTVAVLPLRAEGLAKRNVPLLEEALVTAVAEHLDRSAIAAADVKEQLKPADLKAALSCEAASCWQKVGEKLGVAYLLVVEAVPSGKKLLLSLKLVDVAAKKIAARYQKPVENDPTEYLAAVQMAILELRQRAGLSGPNAVVSPATVMPPTPAPGSTPMSAVEPVAAATPSEPVEPAETPFDAKWPLPTSASSSNRPT